eukprot:4579444-Amphidinium_carterae.1
MQVQDLVELVRQPIDKLQRKKVIMDAPCTKIEPSTGTCNKVVFCQSILWASRQADNDRLLIA